MPQSQKLDEPLVTIEVSNYTNYVLRGFQSLNNVVPESCEAKNNISVLCPCYDDTKLGGNLTYGYKMNT